MKLLYDFNLMNMVICLHKLQKVYRIVSTHQFYFTRPPSMESMTAVIIIKLPAVLLLQLSYIPYTHSHITYLSAT